MKFDFLIPLLTISGIAIGLGILLTEYLKSHEDKFDERQLIERGRGANLAMNVALSYLLCLFVAYSLSLVKAEHLVITAFGGALVPTVVYNGYCIFHDAYIRSDQTAAKEAGRSLRLGAIWLALALAKGGTGITDGWTNGALSLFWLSTGLMLLVRDWMLRIQNRRCEKDDCDG